MLLPEKLAPRTVVAERYAVLEQLATGGFGAVYVAEQLATERRVALKVLWPHLLTNERVREQFALEARIAGRIKSDHVVQVLDAGTDERLGITFLVMELLEGSDLENVVQDSGPPSPALALEYLRQTASGLEKAHNYVDRQGRASPIIHRDLKPSNLFLTRREDGSPLIKILDFGIAKMLSASTKMSGEVKGTPLYMAYEQAAQGSVGPSTDIWAFGLLAFFLYTGRNYWRSANSDDGTVTQLLAEVLTLPLSPASTRVTELGLGGFFDAEFDRWFSRCVHRDSTSRFQSVAEAMRELSATSIGRLGPSALAPRSAPVGNPHTLRSAVPASSLADVPTLEAISNRTGPVAAASAFDASGRRRRVLGVAAGFVALLAGGWWFVSRAPESGPGATSSEEVARPTRETSTASAPRAARAPEGSRVPETTAASAATAPSSAVVVAAPVSSSAPRARTASPQRGAQAQKQPARRPWTHKADDDLYGER